MPKLSQRNEDGLELWDMGHYHERIEKLLLVRPTHISRLQVTSENLRSGGKPKSMTMKELKDQVEQQ